MNVKWLLLFLVGCFCFDVGGVRADEVLYNSAGEVQSASASTSTTTDPVELSLPITFDEFAQGTAVTNQYSSLGIIFGGDAPYLYIDGAHSTSPVLTGSPQYMGDIEGYFVRPDDPSIAITVDWFSFDAGSFQGLGSTLVEWFDINGNKLGEQYNSEYNIEHFYISDTGIASWKISIVTTEDAGYTIDNLDFETINGLSLTKESDVSSGDCITNDEIITYTICYSNESDLTYENAYIVDLLPEELEYYDGDFAFDYMNMDRCYYSLGTLYPDDMGCVELRAVVNGYAEPGYDFTNIAEIVVIPGDEYDPNDINWSPAVKIAYETTDICCPEDNPAIIYISENATGGDTGIDWANAYSGRDGIQKAFNRINNSACTGYDYVLYVGAGTYYPGDSSSDTIELLENMEMYGGFPAEGCDFADRNTKKYKPVLTGQVDDDSYIDINTVVTMGNNTVLDGFIVENANRYCVYGNNADFVLKNCEIRDSGQFGVFALAGDDYGNVTIKSCKINDNEESGVYHEGTGYNLNIYNSWVMRSGYNGVHTLDSTIISKNNIISESNIKSHSSQGIRIEYPTDTPILYGNTISNNRGEGLYFVDEETINDPNDYPDIQNCIIFYNNCNGNQLSGVDPEDIASYCFIQGCSNLALQIYDMDPMFACPEDPNGTPDLQNYHLAYNSVCKDIGNASLVTNDDLDYDNESRIFGSGVDIGADEVYSCDGDITEDDISNALDWNDDGIININEFGRIASAWLSHDPNDPAWIADPNLVDETQYLYYSGQCNLDKTGDSQYQIDISDLEMFLNDAPWLWEACWYGKALEDVVVTLEPLETMSLVSTSLTSSNTMVSVARTTSAIMYVEEEPEADPYEGMSNAELAVGIRDVTELLRAIETQYYYGCEDKEDLLDLMDFLDDELTVLYEHIEK